MINIDAVAFSERHSEEVVFLFTLSVYQYYIIISYMFCSSVQAKPVCFDKNTKLIDGNGGIITVESWGIQMSIPPGAVRRPVEISIAALRNAPDLEMQDGEMLAACGLQCSPSGFDFHSPVMIKIPHCAKFPASADIQVVLYTSDSDTGDMFKYFLMNRPTRLYVLWDMIDIMFLNCNPVFSNIHLKICFANGEYSFISSIL